MILSRACLTFQPVVSGHWFYPKTYEGKNLAISIAGVSLGLRIFIEQ